MKIWSIGIALVSLWLLPIMGHAQLITSGMVLHVNGENVTTKASEKVATMTDLSSTGENLVSFGSGANDGPTLQAASLNGFDTILIDGTLNGLRMFAADAGHLNSGANGLTLFAVMSMPLANNAYYIDKGNTASSTDVGYSVWSDTTSGGRVHARAASDNANRQGTNLVTSNTGWVVFGMLIDPSASTDTASLISMFNGPDTMASGWLNSGKLNTITSAADFRVGASAVASGMQLAEMVVYNRALSETEWNSVGFTLGDKYDITTTFVPEPSSAALFLAAAAGFMVLRRRRQIS